MANPNVQDIIEQQVLTVAKAVEDKIDDEIAALDRLDLEDIEALRERRLQQMKKMAEKRSRWISLGHGEYTEIPSEKDFFSAVKASDRVVCHFYRDNWPCKVVLEITIIFFYNLIYLIKESSVSIDVSLFQGILLCLYKLKACNFEFCSFYLSNVAFFTGVNF